MSDPSLKLIVLKTEDVDALRDFYTRVGFQFAEEQHGNDPVHFSAPLGDGILEIYPLRSDTNVDSTTRLGFAIAGVEAVVQRLAGSAQIVSKPKETQWGTRAVVRDPDGRSVELYEST